MSEFLTVKELAAGLNRSAWYVYGMRKAGFRMPGGTASIEEAREWLRHHPHFRAKDSFGNNAREKSSPVRVL